jgi:hypothetical protein
MVRVNERMLYVVIGGILAAVVILGLVVQGPVPVAQGLLRIQLHPARLLNDFTVVGGPGAALVNAALVAGIALLLVALVRVRLSGPTIAAVFTIFGFGLFGKTPMNVVPIFVGVWVASRIAGKSYREYILMALFGTALGPLITALAVEAGLGIAVALPLAAVGGLLAGILLPSVAISMLRLHQGFNLYNIGLTCGFIGLFGGSLLVAAGRAPGAALIWGDEPVPVLVYLVPAVSVILAGGGLLAGPKKALGDLRRIMKLPGRLPSDFMTMVSPEGSLVNAGVLGLLTWAYVLLVGGDFNGPVLGGIFTAIGFATFGKHPRNSWPVVVGVVVACLVFGKSLSAPGPILAALFVLTLAPVAGEFGWGIGILAGVLHLVMVERTGSWHLGVNLYNNGFAGGLTATLLVAVIDWFRSTREQPEFKRGDSQ